MGIAKKESKDNVNNNYFNGHYKDIWRSIVPPELTIREVDFMLSYFGLQSSDKVLDLMCGYGRHAIALAKKGISVTAVDNLGPYIDEIQSLAAHENLPIVATRSDTLTFKSSEEFDLALCMGNSLNFFPAEDVNHLLKNIYSQLKNGGHVLINSWSLAEIAIKSFVPRAWEEIDGVKHISDSKYLFHPTRIESTSTFLLGDGSIETKEATDYIFSISEMATMLTNSGFTLKEIFSIPGKKKFSLGDPRAYIIAGRL